MKPLIFKFNGSSLLVLLSGAIALFFLTSAFSQLWSYWKLEMKSPASVQEWKIHEKSPSAFAIEASYTFESQGQVYMGKTLFSKPYHFNRPSAEGQIQKFSSQSWEAWYTPKDPTVSSLEKHFPAKKLLYALMALGVFFYFLYLIPFHLKK